MDEIGKLKIMFEADMRQLRKEIQNTKDKIERDAEKMGSSFGNKFKKGLAAVGGIFAFKKALDFAREAKNAARDAEEIRSKFNTVFSSLKSEANSLADEFSKSFGLAGSTARELLGNTGDLLVGFGFAEDQALELSKSVNSLAQDLASFSNYSGGGKGASEALTKALLGETESAKSLGIVIRQNTKEFANEVKQLQINKGLTEQQAKAIVILGEAYKQSGKGVGDYERTKNSLANTERRLQEQFKELKETLGNELVPVFKILIGQFSSMNNEIKDSNENLSTFQQIMKGLGGGAVAIVGTFKILAQYVIGVATSMKELFSFNFSGAIKNAENALKKMKNSFKEMGEGLHTLFDDPSFKISDTIKNYFTKYDEGSKAAGDSINQLSNTINESTEKQRDTFQKVFDDLKFLAKGYTDYRKQLIQEEYEQILKLTGDTINAEAWKNEQLKQLAEERKSFFDDPLQDSMDSEFEFMDELIAKDEERAAKRLEHEQTIADARQQIIDENAQREQETWDANISAASELGNALQNAFGRATDSFISKLIAALQVAIRIADAIERSQTAKGAAGPLGIISSILGFVGLFGHSGGEFIGVGGGNAMKLADGGSFRVPAGYPNDRFGPLYVESGEKVSVTPANRVADQDRMMSALVSRMEVMNMQLINLQSRGQKIKGDFNVHGSLKGTDIAISNTKGQKYLEKYG